MNEELKIKETQYRINQIKFNAIDDVPETDHLDLVVVDRLADLKFGNNKIELGIERKISFNPNGLFTMIIEGGIMFILEENGLINDSLDQTKEYIEKNIVEISGETSIYETISLLVAQISSAFGRVPLITPPTFQSLNSND